MLIVGLALATLAPAASAADGDCRLIRGADTLDDPADDVQVCRQDVWLHKGDHQVANLGSTLPSWNTTKPTGATASAGVYFPFRLMDIVEPNNPDYRPTFKGTFTGTLDTLAATIYVKLPVYEAATGNWPLLTRLLIDGETVFELSPFANVTMQTEGNFRRIRFAFTNLYEAMKSVGLDLSSTKEHTIELSVIQRFWGDGHSVVFYDASDVPSGMIFNIEPTLLKPYTQIDTLAPPA